MTHRVGYDDFELGTAVRRVHLGVAVCRRFSLGGELQLHHALSVSVVLLVAPQGVFPHEGRVARVAAESSSRFQFSPVPGADWIWRIRSSFPSSSSNTFPAASFLRSVRVALLLVDDQVAALLGGEAAEVAFKRPLV